MSGMHRILLADDEPIILSGLQSMLDWAKCGCEVAGTARDGEQAWQFIRQNRPDIVVCDINMPVMTGLELLQRCAEEYPEIVFIMLTNYEDFSMARESLRNRAVDYLLKIDLEEQKLEQSIRKALEECQKRSRLRRSGGDLGDGPAPAQLIPGFVTSLLFGEGEEATHAMAELDKLGAARSCAAVEFRMVPDDLPQIGSFTPEERDKLFSFHRKLVEDLAQKLFSQVGYVILHYVGEGGDSGLLYLWNIDTSERIQHFYDRLTATLGEISQMQIHLLVTEVVSGGGLWELRMQMTALRSEYRLSPQPLLRYTSAMGKTDYVAAAKRYVESHILERVSVQDVAAAIGITPNYLSSLFKRQLGQNFVDYVNSVKTKEACRLLQGNKHLVYEVSHMLGYDNAYYFTKVFKRYTGVTPTDYQSLAAQGKAPVPKEEAEQAP